MSYRIEMTREQSEFYHALFAPFRDDELSEARGFTYVDKRALENRLDTVCGPHGWYAAYREADRGMICELSILVPPDPRNPWKGWAWITKEDGGADEGMVKKVKDKTVEDVDNSFKSEFTNALRRAAQDAWGIGRYLYKKGVPGWLNPNNLPLEAGPATVASSIKHDVNEYGIVVDFSPESQVKTAIAKEMARREPPPTPFTPLTRPTTARHRDVPVESESPPVMPPAHTPPEHLAKPLENPAPPPEKVVIQLPQPGRKVYGWAKDMEQRFGCRILNGMIDHAKTMGIPTNTAAWDEFQVNVICLGAVRYCISQKCYAGEFDHLLEAVAAMETAEKGHVQPAGQGVNIADLRKALKTKMEALIFHQCGRAASQAELRQMVEEVAPQCPTERGTTGEVPESITKTTDPVWIGNMIHFVDEQIAHAKSNMDTGELAATPF